MVNGFHIQTAEMKKPRSVNQGFPVLMLETGSSRGILRGLLFPAVEAIHAYQPVLWQFLLILFEVGFTPTYVAEIVVAFAWIHPRSQRGAIACSAVH